MTKLTPPLMIPALMAFHVGAKPQEPALDGLEKYLNQQMVGPEAIRVISKHLTESGTRNPLEELVSWAKEGFPDLHDEYGYWKTEGYSLKLGVVKAIHYYFSSSPPEDKSGRYLEILRELRGDDLMSHHLASMAYLIVDEMTLEKAVLQLLQAKDPKERSRAVLMGRALAEKQRPLFEHYIQMVKSDDDPHVRVTILYSIASWRRREVSYIGLERLLNDRDPDVRDWGARVLRSGAEMRVLTVEDLPALLATMLKMDEPFVRISLGRAATRLTTDPSFGIKEDEVTDDLLAGFIRRARSRESKVNQSLTEEEFAKLWLDWWTPLIPRYAVRMESFGNLQSRRMTNRWTEAAGGSHQSRRAILK
jgi:hypothetical protein